MNIADAIKKIAAKNDEVYSIIAKVDSVDSSKLTCKVEPINGDATISNVRLSVNESGDKTLVVIPKVGSNVIVTFINKTTAFVSLVAECDKLIIKSSNESLKDILTDLIAALEKLTVGTGVGPSTTPINIAEFSAIKQRISLLLKE